MLLGSERSYGALEGVAMELEDSLYPLLREVRKANGKTRMKYRAAYGHIY